MEVRTTAVAAGGDALGRAPDGRVVFVEGALPDETVIVEPVAERWDHLRARVASIIDAAPDRVAPPCPHVHAGCGGCGWQHITPSAQARFKQAIIVDALRRLARLPDAPVAPTVELPAAGYRTTVRALVVDGRPAFRRRHSHDALAVDSCLVAHPAIEELLRDGDFGDAREVTLRVSVASGERLAFSDPARARMQLPADVHLGRNAHLTEEVLGAKLRVSARSFFQIRHDGAELLAQLVRDAVGRGRRVADLYAGVGLFAATIDDPTSVIAVEQSRFAVADARNNLTNRDAKVIHADVARWKPSPVEIVIADPARSGLGKGGVRSIVRAEPERIVLVSCDAASLARDVKLLRDEGFDLRSCQPVDLFPHTPHIECVSVLDRRA
jgi:23S rRNA (uracil1939-C5)-methyltransferase